MNDKFIGLYVQEVFAAIERLRETISPDQIDSDEAFTLTEARDELSKFINQTIPRRKVA